MFIIRKRFNQIATKLAVKSRSTHSDKSTNGTNLRRSQ